MVEMRQSKLSIPVNVFSLQRTGQDIMHRVLTFDPLRISIFIVVRGGGGGGEKKLKARRGNIGTLYTAF